MAKKIKPAKDDPFGDLAFERYKAGAQDSPEILLNFLREFAPVHKTTGQIFFAKLNMALTPTQCFGIQGGLALVRKLPEYILQGKDGKVRPTTHIALAEKLFGVAGRRLLAELPEGTADRAEDLEALEKALVGFLTKPRVLGKHATSHGTYAHWAAQIAPDSTNWLPCFAHPIYARYRAGLLELASAPVFLHEHVQLFARRYKTTSDLGKALLGAQLIDRGADKGSRQIWVAGRRFRVWKISARVVEAACGSADAAGGPSNE